MKPSIKEKIKDWFSITGIRISNFAKEHKYITLGIGVFLLSALVALVVRATDDKISNAYVSINSFDVQTSRSNSTEDATSTSDLKIAPNFSIVTYTLKYKLGDNNCDSQSNDVVDNVNIVATLNENYSYAKWNEAPEDVDFSINNNVLTIDSSDNDFCKVNTQTFSLTVYNAASPDPNNPGSKTEPEIKLSSLTIKPGTNAETYELINRADNDDKKVTSPTLKTTYDEDKAITGLTVEPVSGIALKKDNGTGRNAKFGLLLGFYPTDALSQKLENGITGLEGSYIATNASDIYMQAEESVGSNTTALDLSTNAEDYGIYTSLIADKHFIMDFPVISSSGQTGELTKDIINGDESSEYVESPSFSLAHKTLTYQKVPTEISEISNIVNKDEKEVACTAANNCSYNITGSGTSYKIEYTVTEGNNSTSLSQDITINTPDSSYILIGPKTQYVVDSYKDYGIYEVSSGSKSSEYEYTDEYYNSSNELVATGADEFNEEMENGTYTVKYLINEEEVATRTIKVGDASYSSIPVKVTSKSVTGAGTAYSGKDLIIGSNSIAICTSSNHCTSELIDSSTNPKKYKYTISLIDNSQKSILNKEIEEKPNYYKLPIGNLILSKDIYLTTMNGSSFYVLGSYFVTVPTSSSNSTIKLSAFTEGNESNKKTATIENKEKSTGTNSFTNELYVMENESYTKVDSDSKDGLTGNYYTASIGETVEVRSTYNYGADADANMNNFKLLIDVNNNYLRPISYKDDASSNTPYALVDITRYGSKIEGLDPANVVSIKYCNSNGCNIDPATYYESPTDDITNIELTFSDSTNYLLPGTQIVVRTNYIVNNIGEDIIDKSFNATSHVSFTSSNENITSAATSKFVYLTPYKTRVNTLLGKGDNLNRSDITLDASKNDNYTLYAPISVTSPAMMLNSNIFGYDSINLPVKFILPKGVNYVYNAEYEVQPDDRNGVIHNSDGTTILTYTYHGVEPNTWIESIYFDFNIDVATPRNSTLGITTQIGDFTTNNITNDLSSSSKFKTSISTITVLNSERVAYGQYAYDKSGIQVISSVDKDEQFIFDTKLYNNEEKQQVTNAYVYTILPSADDNISEYDGDYSIAFPANTEISCTGETLSPSNKDSDIWNDCSNFQGNVNSTGLKAFRVHYPSIASLTPAETRVTITPENNMPDNNYVFQSFLSYDGASSVSSFKNLNVTVISKKITGTVWEDFNDNGIMDDDEKKIENVTLKLYTKDGVEVDETTPNKNGVYTFSGFNEGEYYIVADFDTEKYSFTTPLKNYSDLSKVSVFYSDSDEIVDGTTDNSNTNNDSAIESEPDDDELDDDSSGELDPDDDESFEDEPFDDEEQQSGDIEDEPDEEENNNISIRTDIIVVTSDTRTISNINLGLSLRKKFQVKLNKYITNAEIINNIGVVTKKDYGKTKLAKLDVKDINNLRIKVVYTIELENIKYYPGYIMQVNEIIPDGMAFNPEYSENSGWVDNGDGTLSNYTLANDLLEAGTKKYLTVAFDITRKEAGSFINTASVDDLQILGGARDEEE